MKLYGVSAILFLLVTCAYAGRGGDCDDSSSDSSSENSSYCGPGEVDRRGYEHSGYYKPAYGDNPFNRCDPCEPPRHHHQHHHRHHHKNASKRCKRILWDIKCLIGESSVCISQLICHNFGELASHAKHSVEITGNKAVEEVIANMNNLEKVVLAEIIKDPLQAAIKRIEDIIEDTTRFLEKAIDKEFDKYERESETYITGLIGLVDATLLLVIRDLVGGLLPTTVRTFRDLHKAVNDAVEKATAVELRRVRDVIADLQKDIEKRVAKEFLDSKMLIKAVLEKLFDKEGGYLRGKIEKRRAMVESQIRLEAISIERKISRAISCISSSSDDCDFRIFQSKLPSITYGAGYGGCGGFS